MLSVRQKELYDLIRNKNIPVIEKENGQFFIIYNNKIANEIDRISNEYDKLKKCQDYEQFKASLKEIKSLISAHFQLNIIKEVDLKEFLSMIDDDEIELIKNNIDKTYDNII